MTPSKAMYVRWPEVARESKVLRYQAMPVGKKPPAALEGASWRTGPAMDQSWGRVTVVQEESLKSGDWALAGSDWVKRQLVVNCWTVRGGAGWSRMVWGTVCAASAG